MEEEDSGKLFNDFFINVKESNGVFYPNLVCSSNNDSLCFVLGVDFNINEIKSKKEQKIVWQLTEDGKQKWENSKKNKPKKGVLKKISSSSLFENDPRFKNELIKFNRFVDKIPASSPLSSMLLPPPTIPIKSPIKQPSPPTIPIKSPIKQPSPPTIPILVSVHDVGNDQDLFLYDNGSFAYFPSSKYDSMPQPKVPREPLSYTPDSQEIINSEKPPSLQMPPGFVNNLTNPVKNIDPPLSPPKNKFYKEDIFLFQKELNENFNFSVDFDGITSRDFSDVFSLSSDFVENLLSQNLSKPEIIEKIVFEQLKMFETQFMLSTSNNENTDPPFFTKKNETSENIKKISKLWKTSFLNDKNKEETTESFFDKIENEKI